MQTDGIPLGVLAQEVGTVDLRVKRDPFATPGQAFKEYQRLGYRPTWLDENGHESPFEGETLVVRVRANGLALVTCREGIPPEADSSEWGRTPVFVDDNGAMTFVFASAGELDATVFGCRVRSWGDMPQGFSRLETYVVLPPSKGTWVRPPTLPKLMLPTLPASIRFELARMQVEGAA